MRTSGLAALNPAIHFLAYFWPGPGYSEPTLLVAACASVNTVTRSGMARLLAAISKALASAAHSAPKASWLQPMCVLTSTHRFLLFHTTVYPAAPLSALGPSMEAVSRGLPRSAFALASSCSSTMAAAPSFSGEGQ